MGPWPLPQPIPRWPSRRCVPGRTSWACSRARARIGSSRARARRTSRSSCATAPAPSRRAPSATPTCSPAASSAATSCGSPAASSASATSCSWRSARSLGWTRPPPTRQQFLPVAYRDLDELDGFLEHLAREVHDPGYAALLSRLLGDDELRAEWRRAPCTRGGHHGYLGGLLEHTVAVGTLATETCILHPRLNSDLLVCAALVHDLGKTREFTYGAEIGLTEAGRLLGHVELGVRLIDEHARATALDADRLAALAALRAAAPRRRPGRPAGASHPRRPWRCSGSTRWMRASRAHWNTA